ncbi:N-alpha-acetyltransferase 16, NatA auxiliary subunit [Mortierella alpina]|uniref:N-alpha-acetyltransferase 16, NatA auxiliary subunit n=1 Tax=Mortierella alpina TaxID=64518 RepID=A0A9P6J6F3_MORAP|nr:N-alpha-acetyltransferase 16, NatA auxiliary subunit [Mortierella alpina]
MAQQKSINPLPYSDFRSDTATAPTPEMFAAMMTSSLGDDVYNEDDSVKKLERYVATLCGHEAAIYCSSGTMTNQLAHRVHLCNPPQSAIVDIRSHVFNYEAGGISFHSQAAVHPIMPENGRYLTVADIAPRLVFDVDVHFAPTRVISLENTLNGTIMPIEEMVRIRELTKEHGIKLHLDGARLWHASVATGISLREYCSHFDTISLCLSKGIGAPIGSILVGSQQTIKKARHFRLLFGGGWRQAGFLAEAALFCIKTNWQTMEDTHRQAKWLEHAFLLVGCRITNSVDTNMVWVDTSDAGFTVEELMAELAKEGIKINGSGYAARVVLHYQISDEVVGRFIGVLRKMAKSPRMKIAVDLARAAMDEDHSNARCSEETLVASPPTPKVQQHSKKQEVQSQERYQKRPTTISIEEQISPVPSRSTFKDRPMSAYQSGALKTAFLEERESDHEENIVNQNRYIESDGTVVIRRSQSLDLAAALLEEASRDASEKRDPAHKSDPRKVNKLHYRLQHNPASKALKRASARLSNNLQNQQGFAMKDLPQKEANLFREILKCYELKQYKRGFKGAEQILKKFPEHGETLAMKGLFYNHLDKKEEAYEFVKKGLRHDLKSHICWHVFGLLYRSEKNYEEASKCYSHALKYDKDNIQILRDLSLLQMQMRTFEPYVETRHQLLELRPQNRQYWVAVAIAYQMMGKPELGVKVLAAYEDTLKDLPSTPDYEHSEMLLYHNSLLEETGDFQAALDHLASIEKHVCGRKAIMEKRAKYLFELGRLDEAEAGYRALLALNPDNMAYFEGLRKSLGLGGEQLTAEKQVKLLEMFEQLQKEYPRSNAAKRLPLRYATGEAFVKIADQYLRGMLRKGVPSLFVNIKTLYTDIAKEEAVEKLALGYLTALDKSKGFDHTGSAAEPPTALLWTLYFLAQHFDFKRSMDQALQFINRAIEHTPTLVELLMTKGRILKHAGDHVAAMEALSEARELDLQDRFINTKCVKYMLRADRISEAEKIAVLFTRADIANPLNDLVDMQTQWFSLAAGESHFRQGQIGRALRRFHQIDKHFNDYTEDQFDFHTYCLRKMTLRAYVSLLKLEDQLRTHQYYVRATQGAVQCYITLFDHPDGADTEEMEGMTEAEKKKHRSKQRKAELRAQQEAEEQKKKAATAAEATKKAGGASVNGVKVDEDPEGTKYSKVNDPLGEALKFLRPMQELAADRVETHLMGFEIYLRKNKLLLALRALLKALSIDANHATLHEQLVRFALSVQKGASSLKPDVKAAIDQQWAQLYQGLNLEGFNSAFIARNKDAGSVPHVISAAIAALLIGPADKTKAEALLFTVQEDKYQQTRSLENVVLILKTLRSMRSSRLQEWKDKAKTWYPRAAPFQA